MRFVFVNQSSSLQKRHEFETLIEKSLENVSNIGKEILWTFHVKDDTKKQESAIMQMITAENTSQKLFTELSRLL